MPTSTKNVVNACHPFTTKDFFSEANGYSGTTYILAHNGVISNHQAEECKKEHEKLGIVYTSVQPDGSFNDSEALLWDMALHLEGKKSFLSACGSIAFICLALNQKKGDKLHFGRNFGSPLVMDLKPGGHLFLSSEGEGETVKTDALFTFDHRTKTLTDRYLSIPTGIYRPSSYYNHSTAKSENKVPLESTPSQKANPTQTELLNSIPDKVLESAQDMVWDEETQVLYIKDENNEWAPWDEVAADYARRYQEDEDDEIARMNMLAQEEEEQATVVRGFRDEDDDEDPRLPIENISPTLAACEALKVKKNPMSRRLDIETRFKKYLESNVGNYQLAYMDVGKDLDFLKDEYKTLEASNENDKDLAYEIDITQTIYDAIFICPEYIDSTSIATGYGPKNDYIGKSPIAEAIDVVLNKREEIKPIKLSDIKSFRDVQKQFIAKHIGATGVSND